MVTKELTEEEIRRQIQAKAVARLLSPYQVEQLEIVRRIAERGLMVAQKEGSGHFCDLFTHLLDNLVLLRKGDAYTDGTPWALPAVDLQTKEPPSIAVGSATPLLWGSGRLP